MKEVGAQKKAEELIRNSHYCVLSTATLDGIPESALLEFVPDDKGNIYFETSKHFRKTKNLEVNRRVSLVIHEGLHAVQIEGHADKLHRDASMEAIQLLIEKYGRGKNFYEHDDIVFYRITPFWTQLASRDTAWPPELTQLS